MCERGPYDPNNKLALRRHGYIFIDGEDGATDSSDSENYEEPAPHLKPPPLAIPSDRIVIIGPPTPPPSTRKKRNRKKPVQTVKPVSTRNFFKVLELSSSENSDDNEDKQSKLSPSELKTQQQDKNLDENNSSDTFSKNITSRTTKQSRDDIIGFNEINTNNEISRNLKLLDMRQKDNDSYFGEIHSDSSNIENELISQYSKSKIEQGEIYDICSDETNRINSHKSVEQNDLIWQNLKREIKQEENCYDSWSDERKGSDSITPIEQKELLLQTLKSETNDEDNYDIISDETNTSDSHKFVEQNYFYDNSDGANKSLEPVFMPSDLNGAGDPNDSGSESRAAVISGSKTICENNRDAGEHMQNKKERDSQNAVENFLIDESVMREIEDVCFMSSIRPEQNLELPIAFRGSHKTSWDDISKNTICRSDVFVECEYEKMESVAEQNSGGGVVNTETGKPPSTSAISRVLRGVNYTDYLNIAAIIIGSYLWSKFLK